MECNNCITCNHGCSCTVKPFEKTVNNPRNGGIPLNIASLGDSGIVARITGDKNTISYLTSLGFNPGSVISILRKQEEDLVVAVKDSRIAMGPSIARRIYILPGVLE